MATEAVSPISSETIDEAVAGLTISRAFRRTVEARGGETALRWKNDDGEWREWTWDRYADRACRLAAGLGDLGVEPGGRVAIMMRNVVEFHPTDVAALLCGATPFSMYNSSSPEQVRFLMEHSEATVAVVEDASFLERLLKVRDELPALRHIVIVRDPTNAAPDDVLRWDDLAERDPVDLAAAAELSKPDDLVTLIYTSGTTGPPKAVMLTHHNIAWTAEGFRYLYPQRLEGRRLVSYLPMAHIAERMVSHYNNLYYGTEVTPCPETSQVGAYLADVKPELFFAVPRVWEKLQAGLLGAVAGDPGQREQLDEAVALGRRYEEARLSGTVPDELAAARDQAEEGLALVRSLIGLDQCEVAFSGAAPIPEEVLWFFLAIGVPMSEIYGLSETCGPLTWDPFEVRVGTVGRPWPGCTVRLADDGEILGTGGNIFQGYFKNPEQTAEALDDDGWLHTGDIGVLDDDGYLRVVDRKKELIITAGGKNISPANVEKALKSLVPIGQAAVIGDRRPYLVALLVLDPDVAPDWAERTLGVEAGSVEELARNERVREEIERLVHEVNEQFNRQEQVKKFKLLAEEWEPDSEVLTPTMKLKRRGVNAVYEDLIDELYES